MAKTLNEVKYVTPVIYADEFKELGLKGNQTRAEAGKVIRKALGLKLRSRSRGTNSIAGVARNKEYNDEEKAKIVDFMKGLGKEKSE